MKKCIINTVPRRGPRVRIPSLIIAYFLSCAEEEDMNECCDSWFSQSLAINLKTSICTNDLSFKKHNQQT